MIGLACPALVQCDPAPGSGPCLLRVEASTAWDDAGVQAMIDLLNLLVKAASHGAFPAPGIAPSRSALRVARAKVESPLVLVFALETHDVDARIFQLLRNLCERLVLRGITVRSITATRPDAAGRVVRVPLVDEDNEYDTYPPRTRALHFETAREPVEDRRLRRVVITLRARISAAEIDNLRHWLGPWFALLAAGAYALPVGLPSQVRCIPGDVTLYDEMAAELCVNRFEAAESAWDVLMNMLEACWPHERMIASVEVD